MNMQADLHYPVFQRVNCPTSADDYRLITDYIDSKQVGAQCIVHIVSGELSERNRTWQLPPEDKLSADMAPGLLDLVCIDPVKGARLFDNGK
jgi:hypothetical protein